MRNLNQASVITKESSLWKSVPVQAIEFNTERLAFRAWQDEHRAPFAAMNADTEVMRYFPAALTAEQSNAGIDIWLRQFADQGWSNWAVELRDTGEFIGFIGLTVPRRQLPFSPCVEIGWRLARPYWHRGYASEAARVALRFGFVDLHLEEIVAFTTLGNARSQAVMSRLGMRRTAENFQHPALPEGHALREQCLYRLTRREWAREARVSLPLPAEGGA